MKRHRLLVLSAIALALGCEGNQTPTGPRLPIDPSKTISDGAHGGNPDFFFLPPLVSNPVNDPNYDVGKANGALRPSLTVEVCQLQAAPVNSLGQPVATDCVAGPPIKKFPAGTVQLQGTGDDIFYMVLWKTSDSNLDVTKFYRIRVLVEGSSVPLGIADVDPMSTMKEFKNARTGEVIPLLDDSSLPIKFRVERGALCNPGVLCNSVTVTNNNPSGSTIVTVDGGSGAVAGAKFPNGWLPAGGPQSVVVTISSVNTGASDPVTGAEAIPCHANLPLQQFRGCFNFITTPTLQPIDESGTQFATPVTAAVCYVLQDSGDPREKFAEMYASGPNEPAHALEDASDVGILSPATRNCSSNVIGLNDSKGVTGLASASWRKLKGGLGSFFGVKAAYAVDAGLGGFMTEFSNVGPALSALIEPVGATTLTVAGGTVVPFVRIVGSNHHDRKHQNTIGLGGIPVTFVASAGSTISPQGTEGGTETQLTAITNMLPIDASSTSGGGYAAVNWTIPRTPGTYTLTANSLAATGGPVTFTATVLVAGQPLYVANERGNSITIFAGGATGNATPTATIAGGNTGLNFPYGIARDGAGTIYVTNTFANSITIYAAGASGNATPTATIAGGNTGLDCPDGIARDGAGNIYVANFCANTITVYAAGASGNVTPTAVIAGSNTGLQGPSGITLDGAGNIYVADMGLPSRVTVYAAGASGNATPTATIEGGNTGLDFPVGIARDGAGNIYVTNEGSASNPTNTITVYPAGASGNVTPTATIAGGNTGLNVPQGIALDGAGNIYVANANTPSITVYAAGANGNVTPTATISGSNTGLAPALITF